MIGNTINLYGWQPPSWDENIGNYRIKKYLISLAKRIRRRLDTHSDPRSLHTCLLLLGPSRTGKTISVKLLLRCIVCQCLEEATMKPCDGTCPGCASLFINVPEGEWGLFSILKVPDSRTPVHFFLIDCTKIYSPKELLDKLREVNENSSTGFVIVYLDEVHRLVQRQMDQILLKEVEDARYVWIFSTAKPGPLEDMFQNRAIKLTTELPSTAEMEKLLVKLCSRAGIEWEPEAIVRVIEKSNRVVGLALQALVLASFDPAVGLTLDLVENDWLVKGDD